VARRAGALVVVVLVAYGAVRVLGSVIGGDPETIADGGVESPAGSASSTRASSSASIESGSVAATAATPTEVVATDPEVDTTPPSTAAPSTSEPYEGAPDAEHPATVYIVGDSDAGTFGPYLEVLLDETGIVRTELEYKVSSGLSRPDFFNWPEQFRDRLPAVDPDIVVVTFGGNDAQGIAEIDGEFILHDPVGERKEWSAEYTRRAGEVMDLLAEDGRTVIWVGIPNDDNPEVTARMRVQDQAAKAAAATRPEIVFVDTWARFSGRDGGWAEYVIDPRDREGKDVRADDGFHLNEVGAEILALDIATIINADLRNRGGQPLRF